MRNVVTAKEVVGRIKFDSLNNIELVGEEKRFGHILVNNRQKIGIFIHNEEQLMSILEEVMVKFRKFKAELWQDRINQ